MTAPDQSPEPAPLPRLVEASAIARRMGETFDDADTARVEDYLESATAVVLDEGLDTWTPTTAPARVRVIVIDAVERRVNNPTQTQQRIVGNDLEMTSAELVGGWLTKDEAKAVRRLAGKSEDGAAGTMRSTRTPLAAERLAVLSAGYGYGYEDDDDAYGWPL